MNTGGNPGAALASTSCRMLTVPSRTKTDIGRRTRIGVLTPDDASSLPRAQKERRGTAGSQSISRVLMSASSAAARNPVISSGV